MIDICLEKSQTCSLVRWMIILTQNSDLGKLVGLYFLDLSGFLDNWHQTMLWLLQEAILKPYFFWIPYAACNSKMTPYRHLKNHVARYDGLVWKRLFHDFLYSKVHKVYIRCIYMGTNLEVSKPKLLTKPNPRGCWPGNSWLLPCWDNDPRSCKACPEKQKSHERRFTYFHVIFEWYYSI